VSERKQSAKLQDQRGTKLMLFMLPKDGSLWRKFQLLRITFLPSLANVSFFKEKSLGTIVCVISRKEGMVEGAKL